MRETVKAMTAATEYLKVATDAYAGFARVHRDLGEAIKRAGEAIAAHPELVEYLNTHDANGEPTSNA